MTLPPPRVHVVVPERIRGPEHDLTDEESRRAASFHFAADRDRWTAYRSALRRILGGICGAVPRDVPLVIDAHGKPLLAPPFEGVHFNLSHGDRLGLIAIDSVPVGIDLEPLSRAPSLPGCEISFCHPDEISALSTDSSARGLELLTIWIAKEAVLKALGTGLLHPPEKIHVDLLRGTARSEDPVPGIDRVRIERFVIPGHSDHLAFLARVG